MRKGLAMTRRQRGSNHGEAWLISYADLLTNLIVFFAVLLTAANVSSSKMERISRQISGSSEKTDLEKVHEEIEATIAAQGYQSVVSTRLEADGLHVAFNSGVVFAPGKAEVAPAYGAVLSQVLGQVVAHSSRYRIAVEGHADTTPLASGSRFQSNWELSSARAYQVLLHLKTLGIAEDRLRMESYGSSRPIPHEELAGLTPEERLAKHRRVVIRIY